MRTLDASLPESVFLSDFPAVDPSRIDEGLNDLWQDALLLRGAVSRMHSSSSMISMARILGAPLTVPAGKLAANTSNWSFPGASRPCTPETRLLRRCSAWLEYFCRPGTASVDRRPATLLLRPL